MTQPMTQRNPTACLLVIGNEVLSGRTRDANVQFLANRLGEIGIPLREVRVIPIRDQDTRHAVPPFPSA